MAWYRAGGGGIPSSLKTGMNDVLNKKFGTSTTYAPNTWPDNVNLMGPLPEKTASGAIASFSDGADDVPLKKCEVNIDPNLDGVSSVGVVQTGKNMLPMPTVGTYTHRWLTATVTSDGKITLSGTNTNSQNATINIPLENPIDISKTVYIHLRNTGSNTSITINFGSGSKSIAPINRIYSETPTTGRDYITIYAATSVPDANLELQPSFETTNETTDFTAYNGTTHTATLGRTIYGGSVDVVNGTGTDENGNDFTFTPVPINSLLGDNTLWADTGNVSITYRADIDLALGGG